MKKTLFALSVFTCLGFASAGAFAATDAAKEQAKAMKEKADADYKAAKDMCKEMQSAERKACLKEAKATHEKAKADAHATREMSETNSLGDRSDVMKENMEEKAEADRKARE